ncbi:MAG: hypothetical protein HOC74_12690, partial [Gemmatimonadetes bacterium]|nr:hypothetical protein [Gemmatimonadota bacterium]
MLSIESTTNRFDGVLPDPEALPTDLQEFANRLVFSLDSWRREGLQVVWLEVPIAKPELIPLAVDAD